MIFCPNTQFKSYQKETRDKSTLRDILQRNGLGLKNVKVMRDEGRLKDCSRSREARVMTVKGNLGPGKKNKDFYFDIH